MGSFYLDNDRMSSPVSIFLLELEHGKFYAGSHSDPEKVMEECREGLGPIWTQIHRPVRMREVIRMAPLRDVDTRVRQWMLQYGVDNVRGGSWADVRLSDKDRQTLSRRQDGCIVC